VRCASSFNFHHTRSKVIAADNQEHCVPTGGVGQLSC
jgi:hypothetical protein